MSDMLVIHNGISVELKGEQAKQIWREIFDQAKETKVSIVTRQHKKRGNKHAFYATGEKESIYKMYYEERRSIPYIAREFKRTEKAIQQQLMHMRRKHKVQSPVTEAQTA